MQLRKRLQELREELEAQCPTLISEIRTVEGWIATREKEEDNTYADASGPWEAINRCLDLHGDWKLTKAQIMDAIIKGGYVKHKDRVDNPKPIRGLLNDSLLHQLSKSKKEAKLSLKGDKVGRPSVSV